jgi:YteA family regulatory protein
LQQDKLNYYRQRLNFERETALARLSGLEEGKQLGGLRDTLQELSMYDNHPADIGTETFERSKDLGLRDLARVQLGKIEEALEKIEKGTYGICEGCGKGIPESRLEAVPATTLCFDCQQRREELDKAKRRPAEEGVLMPPFGGFPEDRFLWDENREDRVMYDGEDAWQEVARYGNSSDVVHGEMGVPPAQAEEKRGVVQDVESVPYWRDQDGTFYQDFRGRDDEGRPAGPV